MKPIKIEDLDAIILPSLNGLELIKENKRLEERLSVLEEDTDIIGQSAKIKDVRNLIEKIADSDLPVLIVGETGTGKDIIAKEIHRKSDRNKGKYAQISCALYPGELIERELFGYERGAFLGANASKRGLLEEIDGGTIYIEDIAKMDIKVQSRFLKAIEYGEFKRVGGTKVRKSNVRFVVGTDIDLKQETEKGKFRKDLYHRLTALTIEVPPLRERKEDIPMLVNFFFASPTEIPSKALSNKIKSKSLSLTISIASNKLLKVITSYFSANSFLICFSISFFSEIANIAFFIFFLLFQNKPFF